MKYKECASVHALLALRPADWDERERRRAEEHLSVCAECAALARVYAAQDRTLQALPSAGLGEAARQRLFSRLEGEKRSPAVRPRLVGAAGAICGVIALAAIVLAASILLWQSGWVWGSKGNGPTLGPTQVTMPAPTITPTTSLSPTPVGEKGPCLGLPVSTVAARFPVACQVNTSNPGPSGGTAFSPKGEEGP